MGGDVIVVVELAVAGGDEVEAEVGGGSRGPVTGMVDADNCGCPGRFVGISAV